MYNWFQHIEFAHPWVFGFFLLLPLMVLWYLKGYDKQQGSITVSTTAFLRRNSSWKKTLRHMMLVLRLLAISSLIIALARPQTRNDEELKMGEGFDIILCLDVSGSMSAQDLLPNRLEASKGPGCRVR